MARKLPNVRGRRTFENLCRELEPHLKPNESFVRDPVDVKKQVAISIHFMGSSAGPQNNWDFCLAVCKVVHKVCEAIAENLLEK
ncbi:MAG: hypothetical protein H0A75_08645 [Candidatus Methanofishera endochildressiae]|uniref:Uncharacterized protein n=1 Tax=Candidatus Methanofishera endochildressiae TaxID=2738884 RepID=A0A7Z0SE39_9GAMM|nr:hypothetical protein [Candidatus Methanofishera endochildressiae]